ncbi:Retinoic acid receptor beta [Camelus dromedarius]|uniref:Retinoic acid receptor beta n=1 Tax=Camelus dromedarius TaxID=9838 RepID=A0A5N4DEL6_CAMDR|nr:Retinoic acid receptor beta [Camelus dromedarius]
MYDFMETFAPAVETQSTSSEEMVPARLTPSTPRVYKGSCAMTSLWLPLRGQLCEGCRCVRGGGKCIRHPESLSEGFFRRSIQKNMVYNVTATKNVISTRGPESLPVLRLQKCLKSSQASVQEAVRNDRNKKKKEVKEEGTPVRTTGAGDLGLWDKFSELATKCIIKIVEPHGPGGTEKWTSYRRTLLEALRALCPAAAAQQPYMVPRMLMKITDPGGISTRVRAERAITLKMEIPGPMLSLIREMLENPECLRTTPRRAPTPRPQRGRKFRRGQGKGGVAPTLTKALTSLLWGLGFQAAD